MVRRLDAFVQSLFWHFYWVWHGGTLSKTTLGDRGESILWVCRQCADGRGCGDPGYGLASGLAWYTHFDGRVMGAYLWIGCFGGGEADGTSGMTSLATLEMSIYDC